MTAGFEMGENLGEFVAHHRAEHHMGQACLAQVDEVAEADAQQVGEFLFSQPVCGWGRCIGAHAYEGRVNLVMRCASSLRNEWYCSVNTAVGTKSVRLPPAANHNRKNRPRALPTSACVLPSRKMRLRAQVGSR